MSALVNTHLHETATLALVICILAAITLGFLYVLMRGTPNTTDDDVPPEVLDRIRDRVMRTVHEEGAGE